MLVLASNSPRRKELLALGAWNFTVIATPVDERAQEGELPLDYVRRVAVEKVRSAHVAMDSPQPPGTVIVGADTIVVDAALDAGGLSGAGESKGAKPAFMILGKPENQLEAREMLGRLRGRTHQVYTALAVYRVDDRKTLVEVVTTDVPMRDYSDQEMLEYIASGDPMDKAGAYAIQHPGFKPVQNLHGCFANVMGLPICHLTRLLAELDVHPGTDVPGACQTALEYDCPIFRQVLGWE